jgi:hypothetical protein
LEFARPVEPFNFINMRNLLFLFAATAILSGCKKDDTIIIDIPDDYYKNGVYVMIDPRMELLSAVQHFTSWADEHHTNLDFSYPDDVEDYFSSFSNHSAVAKCQELLNKGFTYDAPVNFMLFHDYPPGLALLSPYSDYLKGRASGEGNLNDFAECLRDFSVSADFMSFYEDHKTFYDKVLTLVFNSLGENNYIELLEDYYGETKYRYIIVPTPLFSGGGYGPRVDLPEGQYVYHIPGPTGLKNGIPTFGSESDFKHVLLHEFSHSFVNPLTEENIDDVNKSAKLFEPIEQQMRDQAYSKWYVCVNEHLVRINVIRMRINSEGEGIKENLIDYEESQGFIYITQIDTLMQRYESNRTEYPRYEDFYPEIIKLFNTLALLP